MVIDKYGCLIMEHSSWEGNRGDSCAETARYAHLKMLLGDYKQDYNLNSFVIPGLGYVRHPDLLHFVDEKGVSWGLTDFSSDQALPLYLAFKKASMWYEFDEMSERLWYSGFRTGNGDLLSPGLLAEYFDYQVLRSGLLVGQVGLFHFKYRWNDELNKFQETEESSCDYINFIHTAVYAPQWVRDLTDKEVLKQKVWSYYLIEMLYEVKNSKRGLARDVVDLYYDVIDRYWR